MQPSRNHRAQRDATQPQENLHRTRPEGMPTQAPPNKSGAYLKKEAAKDVLPEQKPITDEEEQLAPPPRWKKVLVRIGVGILLLLALSFAYVFLLLGEPDEDSQYAQQAEEEQIRMPMSALESPGETNVGSLAQTFGQPVMYLYGSGLSMERSRIYDTAFGGGYARRATLIYRFEDGQQLIIDSVRPIAAITLLQDGVYSLSADALYAIGGVDAAWMENEDAIFVFGQSGTAAYGVRCPKAHEAELETLLKQTALMAPEGQP